MRKNLALALALTAVGIGARAQTTYVQLGTEDYQMLDRLETRSGHLTTDFFTTVKPVSRKGEVKFLQNQQLHADEIGLTSIDRYNMAHAISVSGEWAANGDSSIDSKLPWFKTFYLKQPDFAHVNTNNFFLAVNPVISAQGMYERANGTGRTLFSSSRGVELRARICNKIGLYTYLTDNQEQPPSFVQNWIESHQAVPGADYYQHTGGSKTYDYIQARGYLDFAVIKDVINVTAGYDKHFIGDGIQSLFLSDFSAGASFLRINTKIWKLNYELLYLELVPQYARGLDQQLPHKYASIHHVSYNATKWLNLGLFESVVYGRTGGFEISYANPIIFWRAIERANGSPDNENLGFNFKAIAAKHLQFYGQFLLDEFKASELFSNKGWVGNKYGVQVGGKYFDAFTVKNLDLQGEINIVRPYTFSHYDSIANYTHYNQPLAHPLGAGFAEFIGIARYQPFNKLYLTLKGEFYRQGIDSANTNYGSNIFLNYNNHTPVEPGNPDFGYKLVNGVKANTFLLNLNASYELRENLFIDLGLAYRGRKYDDAVYATEKSTYFYGGFRLNIARRDYNFY